MLFGALVEGFGLLMIVYSRRSSSTAPSTAPAMPVSRFATSLASLSCEKRFMAALGLFLGAMAARSLLFARTIRATRFLPASERNMRPI